MSLLTDVVKDGLVRRYEAPERHYHGLAHVEALLGLLAVHRAAFADPDAAEAAIWFHDAIYDSKAADNEARSAALARHALGSAVGPERVDRVVRMIEATAGHSPKPGIAPDEAQDTALFLDMDLSILGSAPDEYDSYEAGVRSEYGWVDELTWRGRRADFLEAFLARPRLFQTDLFRDALEAQARTNMARSLARLRA